MIRCLFVTSVLASVLLGSIDGKSVNENNKGWFIHVTMHVFSGRINPTWRIPDYHPDYSFHLDKMKSLKTQSFSNQLGYQGFTLTHVQPGDDVHSGGAYNVTVTSNAEWEMYLLENLDIDGPLKMHAKTTITQREGYRRKRSLYNDYDLGSYQDPNYLYYKPTTEDPIYKLTPDQIERIAKLLGVKDVFHRNDTSAPLPLGPTTFEPQKWNYFPVQETNNCYNYANNEITYTIAQPGKKHHCTLSLYPTGASLHKAAECDGLKTLTAPDDHTLPAHDLNLVALVFWPPTYRGDVWDFHWYRLDSNKHWSHKPGKTEATNVDNSKRPITDPRHADRGMYTDFVAFMQTRPDRVKIE